MNNFKPKSKVVLEEPDSIRGEYVQHVPKTKQTQETTQDQIQETEEQENNKEIGNPPEPQNLNTLVNVQQPM